MDNGLFMLHFVNQTAPNYQEGQLFHSTRTPRAHTNSTSPAKSGGTTDLCWDSMYRSNSSRYNVHKYKQQSSRTLIVGWVRRPSQ
jgi:hypothetical protein